MLQVSAYSHAWPRITHHQHPLPLQHVRTLYITTTFQSYITQHNINLRYLFSFLNLLFLDNTSCPIQHTVYCSSPVCDFYKAHKPSAGTQSIVIGMRVVILLTNVDLACSLTKTACITSYLGFSIVLGGHGYMLSYVL